MSAQQEPYRYVNIFDETLEGIIKSITGDPAQPGSKEYAVAEVAAAKIRSTVKMILPFLFPLSTIEDIPAVGAMVGVFFDLTKVFLMATAGMSTSILPQMIGLIPLPLMGAVGMAIGWFISLGFLMAYAAISFSRREFSDTMSGILTMAPVVGSLLGKTFDSVVVRTGTKFANRYNVLKSQVLSLWNKVTDAANLAHGQTIGSIHQAITGRVATALNTLTSLANNNIPDEFAKNTDQPPTSEDPAQLGGRKRFTRRQSKMSKWRKTRHRKSKRR